MKWVVLGASGQLGRDLCPRLPGEVLGLDRSQLDLSRPEMLAVLHQLHPDIVVNCAAYNFVDRAEAEPGEALAVNTIGVRWLAQTCRDLDCVLVHFSSDYVFGLEERNTPWTEDDLPGPVNVYGVSKLAGEYFVRSLCPRHFLIRTCGLYGVWGSGGKGGNFVETMLRLAGSGRPIRVVNDQVCTPTYTVDLAAVVATLVQTQHHGLYHVTNGGACSWYDFAAAIFELAGLTPELVPISTREYGAAARRPAWSVLTSRRLSATGIAPPRPWREALAAYLEERRLRRG